jgi:hypothetical protein
MATESVLPTMSDESRKDYTVNNEIDERIQKGKLKKRSKTSHFSERQKTVSIPAARSHIIHDTTQHFLLLSCLMYSVRVYT